MQTGSSCERTRTKNLEGKLSRRSNDRIPDNAHAYALPMYMCNSHTLVIVVGVQYLLG